MYALTSTAYIPLSHAEIERTLLDLLVELPTSPESVANRLVSLHATGPDSLGRTIEVLSSTFELPLLARFSSAYAQAMRMDAFDQQEQIKVAIVRAKQRVERTLKVSQARFQEVFASSALGIAITDFDGSCVEANDTLAEIVGVESGKGSSLVERQLIDFFHPEDKAVLCAPRTGRCAKATLDRFRDQRKLIRADGEPVWVHLAVSLLRDADGEPTHHVTMVEDISELHLLQTQPRPPAAARLAHRPVEPPALHHAAGTTCSAGRPDHVVPPGSGRVLGRQQRPRPRDRRQAAQDRREPAAAASPARSTRWSPGSAATSSRMRDDSATHVTATDRRDPGRARRTDLCGRSRHRAVREHRRGGPAAGVRDRRELHAVRRTPRCTRRKPAASGSGRCTTRTTTRAQTRPLRAGRVDAGRVGARRDRDRLRAGRTTWTTREVLGVVARLHWDDLSHNDTMALADSTGLSLPIGQWLLREACAQAAAWVAEFGDRAPPLHLALGAAAVARRGPGRRRQTALSTRRACRWTGCGSRSTSRPCWPATTTPWCCTTAASSTALDGFHGGHDELAVLTEVPGPSR